MKTEFTHNVKDPCFTADYDESLNTKFKTLAELVTKKISAEPYDYDLLDKLGAEASQIGETIISQLKDVETSVKASIVSVIFR